MTYAPPRSSDLQDEPRKRSPLFAGLLALVAVGLGHLYCDRPRAAALLASAALLTSAVSFALLAVPGVPLSYGLFGAFVLAYGLWLVQAAWAALVASRTSLDPDRVPHALAYGIFLAVFYGMGALISTVSHDLGSETFRTPSGGMVPTLIPGDNFLVSKLSTGDVDRGQLVAFERDGQLYVRRVFAIAGDRVAIEDGVWRLNGEVVETVPKGRFAFDAPTPSGWTHTEVQIIERRFAGIEHEAALDLDYDQHAELDDFSEITVPPETVFMVGDQLDHSYDSRAYGCVPLHNIVGHVKGVWYTTGPGGFSLERFGKAVN